MNIFELFKPLRLSPRVSAGLLILRLVAGLAFVFHGYGKITKPFAWMPPEATVPSILQGLAALSEFGGGLAWILGLLTPLASFGLACTMAVAVWMHAVVRGDPFVPTGPGVHMNWQVFTSALPLCLFSPVPGVFPLIESSLGRERPIENPYASKVRRKRRSIL